MRHGAMAAAHIPAQSTVGLRFHLTAMRVALLLTCGLCLATGCATSQAEKIQFSELFPPTPEAAASGPELSADKANLKPKKVPLKSVRSPALRQALMTFSQRSRSFRKQFSGQSFPSSQMKNWWFVLDASSDFLTASATASSGSDSRIAKELFEAELELDTRAYGGFPISMVEGINENIGRLALRATPRPSPRRQVAGVPFAWPVQPVSVTSLFGRRLHPIQQEYRVHFGIDLRAVEGQPVTASGPGRVVRAGWNGGHGQQVEILHAGGVVTRYSHLSRIIVRQGTEVRLGDVLGAAGETGQATGTHLHFEFWRSGRPCDPLVELGPETNRPARVAVLTR
jgi:murein DD-endopeptidase MepM/ murein hydrolase activator NlpD